MTTLSVRAPVLPKLWQVPHAAMTRALALANAVIDVYAEAQRQAAEAERRYPFAVW